MKYLFITLLGLFAYQHLFAQQQISDYTIGVMIPDEANNLTPTEEAKLETGLMHLINNSNQAIVGYSNDIVLLPSLSIEETGVVEGGMQNITVVTIDLSLFIKQYSSNIVFNTMLKKIKGSGNTEESAVTNALSKLSGSDYSLTEFIAQAKEKISEYYNTNCSNLIKTARNRVVVKDYEESISILQSIPSSANCFNEASALAIQYYKKYENTFCAQMITKAKSEIAVKNYDEAAQTLSLVDPTSNCAAESNKLFTQISKGVDKNAEREQKLELSMIDAIKEIGKAYYSKKIHPRKD